MPQFLELAQLAHGDGVAQVQIRRGGIVPAIDAQRTPFLAGQDQTLAQFDGHGLLKRAVSVFRSLHENLNLLFQRGCWHSGSVPWENVFSPGV